MNALGINIFGGGFTLGVRRAGFQVVGQFEECDAGKGTFDRNPKYFGGIPRPLRYGDWPLLDLPRVDFLYANPPCAPWSAANTRLGQNVASRFADPRLAMTVRTMQTALALKPSVFALESVARAYVIGRSYYDTWAQKFMDAGYGVTYFLTDALLHGVASTRQRFHFIAHRNELSLVEPNMKTFMPRTTRAAIHDIMDHFGQLPHHMPKRARPEIANVIAHTEQGELMCKTLEAEACKFKFSFLNRRMLWDAPAYTIVDLEQHAHPERARWLTWRESLRLCGYPDDFVVDRPEGATQAVLPAMGEFLGRMAMTSMDAGRAQHELELVDWRDLAKPYRARSVKNQMEESND